MCNVPYISYKVEQPWLPFSEALLDWDEDFHKLMLNDKIRMVAYEKAIKQTVKPGDIVLDLGTGTGILSLWALQAGAEKVYGIDLDASILDSATTLIHQNGFSDKFVPINQLSYEVTLPEKVDVLISEIIGNIADNEDFQPILRDAIRRFLKPAGKCLPQDTRSFLVPVTAENARSLIELNQVKTINDNYSLINLLADKNIRDSFNLYYDTIISQYSCLSSAALIKHYQDKWDQPSEYEETRTFDVIKDGLLSGFKGYFLAKLSDEVTLDISGDDIGNRTCSDSWKHSFFPLKYPISVKKGDKIDLEFSRFYPNKALPKSQLFRQLYRWRGTVYSANNKPIYFDQGM
ncbi:50S ribosomal protein L11 methyltransferase [Sessilibacter corallicola]|uniref:PRMT5 oligomerisation domain-containing protein n=1 Tax=Sessilibacter corallicola TaxID=2904075 RepID=A0ABQ0A9W5_9GAMM